MNRKLKLRIEEDDGICIGEKRRKYVFKKPT
jgi:hypothetical protein